MSHHKKKADAAADDNSLPPYGQVKTTDVPETSANGPLTTNGGAPWANNNDVWTAGARGPTLMQDYQLLQKLQMQNRERIPERTVHAKGWGAYGKLTITHDISKYTCAKVLQKGTETPMLARLSTVAGERGAADMERDVRGFALKFYTEEGNWDMVGNNTPLFFVRDAMKFPDFIHALKRHPYTNQRSFAAFWDFISLSPESLHQITYVMGDRGIPKTLRHMNGYGSHTFSLWNDKKERVWVKFHFKSQQGLDFLTNDESEKLIGMSRDMYGEDLYNAINRGDFPKWKFQIQVMTTAQAEKSPFDPFDLSKVWPHKEYPLIDVGEFVLDRLPVDYFSEIEQAAFSPSNVVPGIGFSPDKMLQARLFAYTDTHFHRVGPNYEQLPVNRPRCPVMNYHRDGAMRNCPLLSGNPNAYYEPNSTGGAIEQRSAQEPPLPVSGDADRFDHRIDHDDYSQVRTLFEKVYTQDQRDRLFKVIAGTWRNVPDAIVERMLGQFKRVHADYEAGCRKEWENVKAAKEYMANGAPLTWDTPQWYGKQLEVGKTTLEAADRP